MGAWDHAWARAIWARTVTIGLAPGRDDGALDGRGMGRGSRDRTGAVVSVARASVGAAHAAIQATMPLVTSTPCPSRQPPASPETTAWRRRS